MIGPCPQETGPAHIQQPEPGAAVELDASRRHRNSSGESLHTLQPEALLQADRTIKTHDPGPRLYLRRAGSISGEQRRSGLM